VRRQEKVVVSIKENSVSKCSTGQHFLLLQEEGFLLLLPPQSLFIQLLHTDSHSLADITPHLYPPTKGLKLIKIAGRETMQK
jgi:hypothetical protein